MLGFGSHYERLLVYECDIRMLICVYCVDIVRKSSDAEEGRQSV